MRTLSVEIVLEIGVAGGMGEGRWWWRALEGGKWMKVR